MFISAYFKNYSIDFLKREEKIQKNRFEPVIPGF